MQLSISFAVLSALAAGLGDPSRAPFIQGGSAQSAQPGSGSSPSAPLVATSACSNAIRDQADPASCLQASTIPELGTLHPLSVDLNVTTSGRVGIGTTSPTAKLHVAGTARVTDTLTLLAGDQALNVSATGSIYKGGVLFIHTKGFGDTAIGRRALASETTGYANTASGYKALFVNTDGSRNTATGYRALYGNTAVAGGNTATGFKALHSNRGWANTATGMYALHSNNNGLLNTACGARALYSNTDGGNNTASGYQALQSNTTGFRNTACGARTLYSNTTAIYNTAVGSQALHATTTGGFNTALGCNALSASTGSNNVAVGSHAGSGLTTGDNNIAIGNVGETVESGTIRIGQDGLHSRTFIAGIRGVTTSAANAIPVLISSTGQLGTVSSSRRFKEEIRDMGELSARLLELRPVAFRYKPEVQDGERPLEYGLIAEEVAEVFPELVVYDDDGQPLTVKYHVLSSILLNELKKASARGAQQEERLRSLETRLAAVESSAAEAAAFPGAGSTPSPLRLQRP